MIYLGSHVSMKAPKYFLGAIEEALSYDANACMIYTGAPQNSKRVPVEKFHIAEAKQLMQEHHMSMDQVIIHAPYIINLANTVDKDKVEFGIEFLKAELQRVAAIGAKILVLHPGSHVNAGSDAGILQIIAALNSILEEDESDVVIALETMAGKGSECGRTLEELAQIRSGIFHKERIKICLDTCHLHDAGYDLSDVDAFLDMYDKILGLDTIACIHINDSKNIRGAHKDRHENIGKGEIGFEILHAFVHHPKLDSIVKILETPYIDGKAPYKNEISKLRSCL